jgi:hypothetical protein
MNYNAFVQESNRIEGLYHPPSTDEVTRLYSFVCKPTLSVEDIVDFVAATQPGAILRDKESVHNVRVGNHIAPASGPNIRFNLGQLLGQMQMNTMTPYEVHCEYLNLHPFTDGNGRSARAIWLWQMNGNAPLGFLHQFYYQTLDAQDARKAKNSS